MIDADKNLRVAEWMGWRDIRWFAGRGAWFGRMPGVGYEDSRHSLIPDVITDLNAWPAVHKLLEERGLKEAYISAYCLMARDSADPQSGTANLWHWITATAAQRTDALLKVIEEDE